MFWILFLTSSVFAHELGCADLFRTPEARAYQAQAAARFVADPVPEEQLVYVGVSRAQWFELLNEGAIYARRWGAEPLRVMPVTERPALEDYRAQNGALVIHARDARTQLTAASDQAWARTVLERIRSRYPHFDTAGSFNFLILLRTALRTSRAATPTLTQILAAAAKSGLPKGPVTKNPEFRTLVDLLEIPWGGKGNSSSGERFNKVMDVFRGVPAEAGIVLTLGPSAIRKILWHESGRPEITRIDLADVTSIEVFTGEDLEIMERL